MALTQRSYTAAFSRRTAEEFIAGETLHGLSQRHDILRQLIRIWVGKLEAGALDEDVQGADLIQEYEGRIVAPAQLLRGCRAPSGVACSPDAAAPARRIQTPPGSATHPPFGRLACRPQQLMRRSTARSARTLGQGPRVIGQYGPDQPSNGEAQVNKTGSFCASETLLVKALGCL